MAFTPAQVKALETWAEQRDTLLREIGQYSTELDVLKADTKTQGLNLADLHRSISEARGRLAELTALEDRTRTSVSNDVAELIARKSRLEAECAEKENNLKKMDAIQTDKAAAIETLILAHDKMSDQAKIDDQVVGHVKANTEHALSEMGTKMAEIRTVALEVIERGNANVAQTNIVLEKLPKYIFELQRPIPIRRTYPEGHPRTMTS